MSQGLSRFANISRAQLSFGSDAARIVYKSLLVRGSENVSLAAYLAEKTPRFYREIPDLIRSLEDGFLLTPFKEVLARLPTADSFRESHFGEIAACLFAEEVLGLRRIYSKLSLLTAENANAYKMDLLLYDPKKEPLEFVFGEVKGSPKTSDDGLPVGHDKSCFASLFNSLREYGSHDLDFDLATIKDRLSYLPAADQPRIRQALLPYSNTSIRYAGFAVIDHSTVCDSEIKILATRKSNKEFDVDLVCIDGYPLIASDVFGRLTTLLEALRSACS